MVRPSSTKCIRVREQVAYRLDAPLSEFESAAVEAHLEECGPCRQYAADLAVVTGTLRTAPLEEPELPFVLPRNRRAYRVTVQAAAAAAAVVVVAGLSGVFGPLGTDRLSRPQATTSKAPTTSAVTHERGTSQRAVRPTRHRPFAI